MKTNKILPRTKPLSYAIQHKPVRNGEWYDWETYNQEKLKQEGFIFKPLSEIRKRLTFIRRFYPKCPFRIVRTIKEILDY